MSNDLHRVGFFLTSSEGEEVSMKGFSIDGERGHRSDLDLSAMEVKNTCTGFRRTRERESATVSQHARAEQVKGGARENLFTFSYSPRVCNSVTFVDCKVSTFDQKHQKYITAHSLPLVLPLSKFLHSSHSGSFVRRSTIKRSTT